MSQSAPRPGGAVRPRPSSQIWDPRTCAGGIPLSLPQGTLKTFPDVVAAPLSLAPSTRTLRCIFRGRRSTSIIHSVSQSISQAQGGQSIEFKHILLGYSQTGHSCLQVLADPEDHCCQELLIRACLSMSLRSQISISYDRMIQSSVSHLA